MCTRRDAKWATGKHSSIGISILAKNSFVDEFD